MIDYWKLVKDFAPGDAVQRFAPGVSGGLSPFLGRVTAVHKGTGFVDVQWPSGNERVPVEDLVRVNPDFAKYLPPSLNFSWYPGFDVKQASGTPWRTDVFHPDFYIAAANQWLHGVDEVTAYDELWHKYGSRYDDELLRAEVAKLYAFGRNSATLRLRTHMKTSAYWVAQNRQYRVTSEELRAMKPSCPKCGTLMRKTTYKMTRGVRERLFACPKCLFLIKRENLLSPDGQPVEW